MAAAGGAAPSTDSRGRFQPPKWCRPPREPGLRPQGVRFVTEGGAPASGRASDEAVIDDKAVYTIGRADTGVDVRLRGELASRLHAAICQDAEGRKFLVDLRSTHGTFLGGKRLEPHVPARWQPEVRASFGSGPSAEHLDLLPAKVDAGGGAASASSGARAGGAASSGGEDSEPPPSKKPKVADEDPMAALYGDLPEAKVNQVAPKIEERRWAEPAPVPAAEPTRVIFLDVDGVLRAVHGRTDFAQNVRTMVVNGSRVALSGDSTSANDNLAGIDFWPQAMWALRAIVQRTRACIVLSSDWRKQEQLVEGINNQLREYSMPKLYGQTPDLDAKNVAGVVKALHSNVREKRAKEIRRWLRQHPKTERWVAIDDMDLSPSKKDELLHYQSGSQEPMPFLDPMSDFVRCNPAVGLTMDLAKLAVAFLTGARVSPEDIQAAYQGPQERTEADPSLQSMGPLNLVG